MNKEIWKDIPGYEGLYQASNLGNIKSLNYNHTKQEKIMKQTTTKYGYKKITMFDKNKKRKTKMVHQLIAETFIDNSLKKPFVLHKIAISNGGTNEINNLYWGNNSDNMKDRTKDGHFKNPRLNKKGKDNPTCKPVRQLDLNKKILNEFVSITEASKKTGINYNNIILCCNKYKYRKTAGGYIWEYNE